MGSSSARATRSPPRCRRSASRKGDRVALLLPNCPQFLIAEFGIWKAGAIVVALNPTYTEREIEQALDARRVPTPIVDADAVLRAGQARAGASACGT